MSRAAGLPEHTARLFPNEDVESAEARGLLIERILEDGDGDDLRWLTAEVAESELADWVTRAGGRKLSRRSRAYWSQVLGVDSGTAAASAATLWPLA